MGDLDLDAIEARANAALSGPWSYSDYDSEFTHGGGLVSTEAFGLMADKGTCRFIAHAREDVPRLVAEVRRLRAEHEGAFDVIRSLSEEKDAARERLRLAEAVVEAAQGYQSRSRECANDWEYAEKEDGYDVWDMRLTAALAAWRAAREGGSESCLVCFEKYQSEEGAVTYDPKDPTPKWIQGVGGHHCPKHGRYYGSCASCAYDAERQEEQEMRERLRLAETKLNNLKNLVAQQAEDEGLWFEAVTASEAYLQYHLRYLHRAVEREHLAWRAYVEKETGE